MQARVCGDTPLVVGDLMTRVSKIDVFTHVGFLEDRHDRRFGHPRTSKEPRPIQPTFTLAVDGGAVSGPYAGPKLRRPPRTDAHPVDSAPESVLVSALELPAQHAPGRQDLLDDLLSRPPVRTRSVGPAAQVVDDHLGALVRQ